MVWAAILPSLAKMPRAVDKIQRWENPPMGSPDSHRYPSLSEILRKSSHTKEGVRGVYCVIQAKFAGCPADMKDHE